MPGLAAAQPLRHAIGRCRVAAGAEPEVTGRDVLGRAGAGGTDFALRKTRLRLLYGIRNETHRAAPKAGLNRRDLARHYNEKSAGERFPRTVPASGFLIRAVAKHHVPGRSMMMNASELRDALGPLAQSLPRVFLILLCGAVAIIAAVEGVVRLHAGATNNRVLAAWMAATPAGVVDGCLAFTGFRSARSSGVVPDPLSPEGLLRFASGERLPIGAAAVTGRLSPRRRHGVAGVKSTDTAKLRRRPSSATRPGRHDRRAGRGIGRRDLAGLGLSHVAQRHPAEWRTLG